MIDAESWDVEKILFRGKDKVIVEKMISNWIFIWFELNFSSSINYFFFCYKIISNFISQENASYATLHVNLSAMNEILSKCLCVLCT